MEKYFVFVLIELLLGWRFLYNSKFCDKIYKSNCIGNYIGSSVGRSLIADFIQAIKEAMGIFKQETLKLVYCNMKIYEKLDR